MASLSSNARLGNVGASSLLKSAKSVATQMANNQDTIARMTYANSAYTDEAYKTYTDYLNSRISSLQGEGTPASEAKILSLTNELRTAMHENISGTIARENIAILFGSASKTDKLDLVQQQAIRAYQNGDATLAQSLESQAYSLSQSIQYDNQVAAAARTAAATAAGTATAKDINLTATSLEKQLNQFVSAYQHTGPQGYNKDIQQFMNTPVEGDPKGRTVLQVLSDNNIFMPKGSAPNVFDVISGVRQAQNKLYNMAGDAVANTAADGGQSWYDKGAATIDNIPTPFGKMNAIGLEQAARNPNMYHQVLDPDLLARSQQGKTNPQIGYKYDPTVVGSGNNAHPIGIVPVVSSSPLVNVPNNLTYRLQQLGLQPIGGTPKAGAGTYLRVEVTPNSNIPGWLKKAIPSNSTTNVFMQPNGDIQFESFNANNSAIYTVTTKNQLYARDGVTGAYQLVSSDPLNPNNDIIGINTNGLNPYYHQTPNGPHLSLNSDFHTVNDMIQKAQQTYEQVSAATLAAARALIPAHVPNLPNITVAPPVQNQPIQPASPQASKTVYPTAPVAPKTVNPQAQSGVNLQSAGNFNLQAGGGGIKV